MKRLFQTPLASLALQLVLICPPIIADEKPEWISRFAREDATYRYYQGTASNAPDISRALNDAYCDVLERSVKENFGFKVRAEKQSYETLNQSSATKRIDEITRNHEINDFEEVERYVEGTSDKVNAWVLYRYKKSAIAAEKLRLIKVKDAERAVVFAEAGNAADSAKGVLEVVTEPAGATVFIDGQPITFMETPLKLYGKVPIGVHTIRIDHPQYEAIEREIIINPGEPTPVKAILLKATGRVKITSDPPIANVSIGGKPVGVTPTEFLPVPAGETLKIALTHPECQGSIQEFQIERGAELELPISLLPKPASIIGLLSTPLGAKIFIDDKESGTTPLRVPIAVQPGTVRLLLRKEGYKDHEASISIKGGEKKSIGTIRLTSLTEIERAKALAERKRLEELAETERARAVEKQQFVERMNADPTLIVLATIGMSQSSFKDPNYPFMFLAVGFQYRLSTVIGIEVGARYSFASIKYSDASVAVSGWGASLGVPISVLGYFSLTPEWLHSSHNYTTKYAIDNTEKSAGPKSQQAIGLSIGHSLWFKPRKHEDAVLWGVAIRAGYHHYYANPPDLSGNGAAFVEGKVTLGW